MVRTVKIVQILIVLAVIFTGCKEKTVQKEGAQDPVATEAVSPEESESVFGMAPSEEKSVSAQEALLAYGNMKSGDTLQTAFRAEVLEVCQAKGCWMRLALSDKEQVMVRFKDYGFFVPKDLAGSEVLIEGLAFISEVPEEERKHLAEDGGATEEELSAIVGSAKEYGFEASGVRLHRQ